MTGPVTVRRANRSGLYYAPGPDGHDTLVTPAGATQAMRDAADQARAFHDLADHWSQVAAAIQADQNTRP